MAADAAGQPGQAADGQAQPRESAAPKVASSEGASRSARLGRQIPLEGGSAASGKEPAGREQAPPASAPDKPLAPKVEPEREKVPANPDAAPPAQTVTPPKTSQPEMAATEPVKPGPSILATSPAPDKAAQPEKATQQAKAPTPDKPAQPGKGTAEASSQTGPDAAKPPRTGKLLDIRTQDKPGEVVLTIVTDMPPEKVTKFLAGKPNRFVMDLWGAWRGADPATKEFDSELIERARIGWHQGRIRVVIDYREKEQSGLREPVIDVSEQGVVVRMAKPGKKGE